jgi:hypothetical protein
MLYLLPRDDTVLPSNMELFQPFLQDIEPLPHEPLKTHLSNNLTCASSSENRNPRWNTGTRSPQTGGSKTGCEQSNRSFRS